MARSGVFGFGPSWTGMEWQGSAGEVRKVAAVYGSAGSVTAWQAGSGLFRRVAERCGSASFNFAEAFTAFTLNATKMDEGLSYVTSS